MQNGRIHFPELIRKVSKETVSWNVYLAADGGHWRCVTVGFDKEKVTVN